MIRRVLLLHGLFNPAWWLVPLAGGLRKAGLEVDVFGYPTLAGGSERAIVRLQARLRAAPVDAIVGHSLGGLVALEALRLAPDVDVARVVCLGSPLRGSAVAAALADRRWGAALLGRHAALLRAGVPAWQGAAAVGVVAGHTPRGLGRLFAELDGEHDGTVAVAETRLPGIAAHCVVQASHTGLVVSAEARRQVLRFLQEGRFEPAVGPPAV